MPIVCGTNYNFVPRLYDTKPIGYYGYKYNKKEMDLYKRKYKYLNTKTNKIEEFYVYDLLKHLREDITYSYEHVDRGFKPNPYSSITYKLIDNDSVVHASLQPSFDQSLRLYIHKWNNTIFMKVDNRWEKSDSGWFSIAHKLILKMKKEKKNQADIKKVLGKVIADYLFTKPTARVMFHIKNYKELNETEKKFVCIIFNFDGSAITKLQAYIGVSKRSNFLLRRKYNPFSSSRIRGQSLVGQGWGIGLEIFAGIPFKYLTVFSITKKVDFNFDENCYQKTEELSIDKKIFEHPVGTVGWMASNAFKTNSVRLNLTRQQTNRIKNFNDYENQIKNSNLDGLVRAATHSYFLYENQNIIIATFVSEIN